MSALREWQRQFIAAVVSGDASDHAIHRNNWRCNLRAALRVTYPVIERLVGREFFDYCADRYIDAQPSRSSNLDDYGHEFSLFLRDFEPAQSLPYLVDVATLELALDRLSATAHDIAQIIVQSPFPILKIWQCNQAEIASEETIDLDSGGDTVRLQRTGLDLIIERIDRTIEKGDADAQNATSAGDPHSFAAECAKMRT